MKSSLDVFMYIKLQFEQGNFERVLKFADLLLSDEVFEKHLEVFLLKASAQIVVEQESKAIETLSTAIALFPASFELRMKKSLTLMNMGRFLDAKGELESLDLLFPNNIDVFSNLIYVAEMIGQYREVIGLTTQILDYYPGRFSILIARSAAFVKFQEYEKAINDILLALKEPELDKIQMAIAYSDLGFVFLKMEDFDESKRMLEVAIEYDELDPYTFCNLGVVLANLGRVEDGLDMVNHALELDGQYSYAFKARGLICLMLNKLKLAIKDFRLAQNLGYEFDFDQEVNALLDDLVRQNN